VKRQGSSREGWGSYETVWLSSFISGGIRGAPLEKVSAGDLGKPITFVGVGSSRKTTLGQVVTTEGPGLPPEGTRSSAEHASS